MPIYPLNFAYIDIFFLLKTKNLTLHVLNGDALQSQFPNVIKGNRFVFRECLLQGDVSGKTLSEFFQNRAIVLATQFGEPVESYQNKVVTELENLLNKLPKATEVNLWFEDDLFCQVNLWFLVHLIQKYSTTKADIYLVRPLEHTRFGFGGLHSNELIQLVQEKMKLSPLEEISNLWTQYQNSDWEMLEKNAKILSKQYPFIAHAVQAQLDRLPQGNSLGKPAEFLLHLINHENITSFPVLFQTFSEALPIYGYGDAQVQMLLSELKEKGLIS